MVTHSPGLFGANIIINILKKLSQDILYIHTITFCLLPYRCNVYPSLFIIGCTDGVLLMFIETNW